jgi:hypothetical protein
MNLIRLLLLACAGGVASPLFAQSNPSPFVLDKAYSAEQLVTTRDGHEITSKIYVDDGRIRSEMTMQGMDIIAIVLPAQQKVYSIMPAQNMVMVMPYDPAKYGKYMIGTPGFEGKFDPVGPDTVDGVACNKYKVTTHDKTYFLWVDAAKKQPVKMAAEDGSFTSSWKNYQAGPQPATLFDIPTGYQVMDMPAMPNMPGGGALPGGDAPSGP